jgi:hypothetical protein
MDRPTTRSDPATTKIEYGPLLKYLRDRYANTVVLTFQEIDDVLGASLPEAAHRLLAWWTDPQADGSPSVQSLAWTHAGRTATPNFLARTVRFERDSL